MPTVIAYHDVKDQKHWLSSPKRAEVFGSIGVTDVRTFIDPTNPNRVGVLIDVPDMEKMKAMLESQAGADAMEYDGVIPESIVVLVEA